MSATEEQINDLNLIVEYSRREGNQHIGLTRTKDKKTGEEVTILVIFEYRDSGIYVAPVARMFSGDPFNEVEPPEGVNEGSVPLPMGDEDEPTSFAAPTMLQ